MNESLLMMSVLKLQRLLTYCVTSQQIYISKLENKSCLEEKILIYLLRKVRSHEEGSQFFGFLPVAAPGLKLGAAREVPFLLSQNFFNKILRGFSYLAS
jgi:hypothetical protein